MKKLCLFRFFLIILTLSLLCSCTQNTQGDILNTSSNHNEVEPSVSLSLMSAFNEKDFLSNILSDDFKINSISFDKNSDNNIFLATNYGIFASYDGGKTFKNNAVGIASKNVDLVVLDPNNSKYVVAICVNKEEKREASGIYISENSLQGFQKTENFFFPVNNSKIQLVFDPSSYENGKSSIVYLTGVISLNDGVTIEENALYRSNDGGKNFTFVSTIRSDSEIAVHPTKGYVYLTDSTGFYRSIDHGNTFETMTGASSTHVFISTQNVNRVILAGINGMLVSNDGGETFESTEGIVPRMGTAVVAASVVNESNMVSYYQNYDGSYAIEYSKDGGATWKSSNIITQEENNFSTEQYSVDFSWSAIDDKNVIMVYDNQVYKSQDGGENFYVCEDAIKGFDITSRVAVNSHTPSYKAFIIGKNIVSISLDNGESWEFFEFKNLALNEYLAFAYPINRTSTVLTIGNTTDSTYAMAFLNSDSGVFTRSFADQLSSFEILGDAGDKNLIFAGNYYSFDSGKNWHEMLGCDAVLTQNPYSPGELFGVFGKKVVISVDKGRSWRELFEINGKVYDMAYDYFENNLYVATGNELYKYTQSKELKNCTENIPLNTFEERIITSVEVDISSPGRVYICGAGNGYVNDSSIMLSVDSGEKWYVISASSNNSNIVVYSNGIQSVDITVDSANGILTSYGGMYGLFEFDINKTLLK